MDSELESIFSRRVGVGVAKNRRLHSLVVKYRSLNRSSVPPPLPFELVAGLALSPGGVSGLSRFSVVLETVYLVQHV